MRGLPYSRHFDHRNPLHIVHCNTQRSPKKHRILLDLAHQNDIHCICVQEPWINRDLTRHQTQSHSAYNSFSPIMTWDTNPRVMIYVRKNIKASQILFDAREHPDIMRISLQPRTGTKITITNVYNAQTNSERTHEAVTLLQSQPCPENHILCGDFNLHHHRWDTRATSESPLAEDFSTWTDVNNMLLLTDRNIPTRRNAVLDLSFASASLLEKVEMTAEIDDKVDCNSDHRPVRVTLNNCHRTPHRKEGAYQLDKIDSDKFNAAVQENAATLRGDWSVSQTSRTDEVTRIVVQLQNTLATALNRSTPRSSGTGCGKPYWNEDCRDAAKMHRYACRWWKRCCGVPFLEEESRRERKRTGRILEKAVWKAKSVYYADQTASLNEPKDIFKSVKNLRRQQRYQTPPLTNPQGGKITETKEKIELLMRTHVSRESSTDLVEGPNIPPDSLRRNWTSISIKEAERAVLKPANTAPGIDGIPNAILKLAWPYIGSIVTTVFNMSLVWGIVPDVMKSARLCVLPKGNKRDKSNPRSYRLIALLPTLAKCLERIVARRLAFEGIEYGIIPSNYMCAVPKRATTDLLLSLADELEYEVMTCKMISTVVTFDIKGAFDAVGPNRMVQRLVEQRWPSAVCRWVVSFLSRRRADVSLDGVIGEQSQLGGSLPQGSPLSPILFMLFMAPLYQISQRRRGYADDGAIIVHSKSFTQNVSQIQHELTRVHRWCTQNGLELDFEKSEISHFTRRQTRENPGIQLPSGTELTAVSANAPMKWLGVLWDRKLTFSKHIHSACAKTDKVIDGFRLLAGCFKGAPVSALLNAIRAAVLPVLTYGFQAWWRAKNQKKNKGLLDLMDKTVRRALRTATPVYRTTPSHLIHHAAGFPPMEIILDDLLLGESIRMSRLDPAHIINEARPNSRIRWIRTQLLPRCIPPATYLRKAYETPLVGRQREASKENQARDHLQLRRQSSPSDIWIYSDGSRQESGRTGAGWVVARHDQILTEGRKYCGVYQEVIDAEAIAAREAVRAAMEYATDDSAKLWLCLDNLSVVQNLQATTTEVIKTSQRQVDSTAKQLRRWRGGAEVLWTPGHVHIEGNERADQLAKTAAAEERVTFEPHMPIRIASEQDIFFEETMSQARARRWRWQKLRDEFRGWWQTHRRADRFPEAELEVPLPWQGRIYKGLCRSDIGRVLAARSHHGDFRHYHQRFQHQDAVVNCRCGATKDEVHPWTCKLRSRRWSTRFVNQLLCTSKGLKQLACMLRKE